MRPTLQYGSVVNRLRTACVTVEDLKSVIEGEYEIVVSPCLPEKVKGAVMMKKLLSRCWAKPLQSDSAGASAVTNTFSLLTG
ncbi:hypothetical protein J7E73_28270 [Paenibacillus albidus]|uniref:hypothetical protein n=1 Tax=Paenibacillus albidus TaxID=2041023 RepID=UPI001BEC2A42|nr:hypothetical protein [Paenibacillus albidus]MBT2292942.1 hypothetical protein [Paenibacillus albidus]